MATSQRGIDGKLILFCPNCKSQNIVINGHYHNGKPQFFCKKCKKYFYENSSKGYPPTNIPFPVIAYFLYFRRRIPEFSNMREFRKFVNHWLKYLEIKDKDSSRHIINHWIKNYEKYLNKIITFSEASNYVHNRLKKLDKARPSVLPIPYKRALIVLEKKYGKHTLVNLLKTDKEFFTELVEIVSKHGVFGWEFLEAGFGGVSVGYRSTKTTD